jgi:cytochrome c-type biogenesis protein CcmF
MEKYAHLQREAQTIANGGKAMVWIALCLAIVTMIAYVLSWKRPGDKKAILIARGLYAATSLTVLAIFGLLASRVYGMDFRFDYVFKETGRDLIQPDVLHYWLRFAATWAGQEGSFLLWASWTCLLGFLVFAKAGKYEARVMPFYISIIAFLCAILVRQTPFGLVPLPSAADFANNIGWQYPPIDGSGLNASLQNYWMTIHPPTIFFGFASLAVPFAYAMAALIWKDYDGWTPRVMPYALLTCATLGIGLFMGGYWAYETQGWHGFWAWDPVENASFFPWLAITALVHGLVVQKSRGGMGRTNTFLAIFAFWLFLLGTFLTRSGVLSEISVHSFGSIALASKYLMIAMMVIYGISGLGLWLWRFRTIPARKTLGDSLVSRDFAFFMVVVLMVAACLIVTLGTTAPVTLTWFHRKAVAPEAVFYNKPLLPLAIITAFFMGIVPWLAWRKTDTEKFLGKLVGPWFLMLIFGFFMIFWTLGAEREWMAAATAPNGVMEDPAVAATWAAWGKNVVLQRMAVVTLCSLGFLATLSNSVLVYKVFRSKPLAAGGWLAHVGIGIMMIGIVVSNTYERSTSFTLMEGMGPKEAFGYQFNYERMTGKPIEGRPLNPDYDRINAVQIRVTPPASETPTDGGAKTFLMSPRWFATDLRVRSEEDIKHTFWPAIQKYYGHDLYLSVGDNAAFRWPTDDPEKTRPGIILQQGERRKLGDYVVGYYEPFGEPGKLMGVHLVILVPGEGGKIVDARPAIRMEQGAMTAVNIEIPEIKDANGNSAVAYLDGLDPKTKAATLRITLPSYNGAWAVPLIVTYKPWVNMVWIGVLIAVSGTLLAMIRRALEARRLPNEPVEPRIETNTWEMPSAL